MNKGLDWSSWKSIPEFIKPNRAFGQHLMKRMEEHEKEIEKLICLYVKEVLKIPDVKGLLERFNNVKFRGFYKVVGRAGDVYYYHKGELILVESKGRINVGKWYKELGYA